jgi:hypothetical protein
MAEDFRDNAELFPLLDQERCVGMAEIVEPLRAETSTSKGCLEALGDMSCVERMADGEDAAEWSLYAGCVLSDAYPFWIVYQLAEPNRLVVVAIGLFPRLLALA